MPFLLLVIFIVIPIVEIGLFIQVGGMLGLWWTLAIVIITAIIGTYLLRKQGLDVVNKLQSEMAEGQLPVNQLIHGTFIVIAGLLLLTPGFFTDFIGFSLFVPQIRLALGSFLGQFIKSRARNNAGGQFQFRSQYTETNTNKPANGNEIDGEYSVVEDDSKKIDSDNKDKL